MTLRCAFFRRPVNVVLLVALSSLALLAGVVTRADEPVQTVEKAASAHDRLDQASALIERLTERVKTQREALQKAEAELELARKQADELAKQVVEEWKTNVQRRYEADKRNQKELRGDRLVPKDSPVFIGPLGKLQD
jgi:septal ring factor EnvC (AmiA/AmiB activator)